MAQQSKALKRLKGEKVEKSCQLDFIASYSQQPSSAAQVVKSLSTVFSKKCNC